MNEWIGAPLKQIDELQGFDAMVLFLDAYWKRTGRTDDIASLLGDISRDIWSDGSPGDPGAWEAWRKAVQSALQVNGR